MGDALCGPSNALQNFQKHTSVDRTLQQDRLSSQHGAAQGFRSHNHNEGVLDSEFNTFETGISGPALPSLHGPSLLQQPAFSSPHFNQHGKHSGWATDFEHLHISSPSASVVQTRLQAQTAIQNPVSVGWQNDFMNNSRSGMQSAMPQRQMMHNPMMNMPPQTLDDFTMNHGGLPQTAQSHDPQGSEIFDDSAFEAAFAEARAEVELQENNLQLEGEPVNIPPSFEQIRIGSDTIPAQHAGVDEAEELARTAGQLLESVSHDQSQKFKESNFLALMRQLRDREVTVEGDEFRQVSTLP
ncbi:hypothetical protein LOZ65_006490 [Ophidiomyces ophidiicola]|nr:hypothetical protein LOZ65_006490 [Ophidiomyces ophidiicola]